MKRLLEELGGSWDWPQRVKDYSLGMRQKVGLTQALMENPKLAILDEPFNALDEDAVSRTRSLLRQRVDDGMGLLFSSHNNEDVESLANVTYRLNDGRLSVLKS